MSMKSLLAIQNSGLGAYGITDPIIEDGQYVINPIYNQPPVVPGPGASVSTATQSPEEALAAARRLNFLAATRPGFDYGINSDRRNAFFSGDSGLGFDIFGTVAASVRESAPEAFKGVKLPGISLPSWVPRVGVPKKYQAPLKTVAERAAADIKAKKAAEQARKEADEKARLDAASVANRISDTPQPPKSNSMNPWVLGGIAALLVGVLVMRKK